MRTEDGYIVNKCLNGDSAAFALLVDKYKAAVYALAYHKLRNFHDAEDITQEVFIKAYQKLRTLRRWDKFLAWLHAITYNLCRDFIRARTRRPDREFIEDQNPETIEEPSTDSYRDDLVYELLHEALDSLPEMYCQVLTLHYLGGMNSREIAEFLGTSPTAIRQRLTRGRSQLKEGMLAIVNTTFERQKLQATFTFRIVEIVKRTKIQPMTRTTGLPWGVSLAAGLIIAILSIGSHFNILEPMYVPMELTSLKETDEVRAGEIRADILKHSRIPAIFGSQGSDDRGNPGLPEEQEAVLLAPRGEAGEFPEEPAARLGRGTVNQVAYSPDGKLAAAAGSLGIWLYDANTLEEIGVLGEDTGKWMSCIAFSPDGKVLASGDGGASIRLWDVAGQKQIAELQGHTKSVNSVSFSPDGKMLASGSVDKAVRLWDVQSGEQLAQLRRHKGYVNSVAFSPDGKMLASGGTVRIADDEAPSGEAFLWDVAGQKQMAELQGYTRSVYSVSFSPDGKVLATSGERIRLWGVAEQKQVAELNTGWVSSIAFSPDGKILASGSSHGGIRLWDVQSGKQLAQLRVPVYSIAFSPDGKTLASASSETIRLWDVQTQKEVGVIEGFTAMIFGMALSPDGKILASVTHNSVRLWDVAEQKQMGMLEGHTKEVNCVAFSPDGKILASGSYDKAVRLWDVAEQKQVGVLEGYKSGSLAFSPDGKILASGGRSTDKIICLWDVTEQKQLGVLDGPAGEVWSVAFSPDGKILASGSLFENVVRLWDVAEKKQLRTLEGHVDWVLSVAFSPDGEILASGSKYGEIILWDVQEWKQLAELKGHKWHVYSFAFNPDGRILASAGADKTVRLWSMDEEMSSARYKEMATLRKHTDQADSVVFSPDGKQLFSGSLDGTVLIWDLNLPDDQSPLELKK